MSKNLIVIDITDYEHAIFDGSSKLKDITGNGKLLIKNPSQKSRLWNLDCDLKETVNTSIDTRELNIGTLNPTQQFIKEYELRHIKSPTLKIEEIFDTATSIPERINNVFIFQTDNKCLLKLILENPLELPILEIKLKREIPIFMQEIELRNPTVGESNLKEEEGNRFLTWDITSLDGRSKAELEIYLTVNVKDLTEQELGALTINYLINNFKIAMINPEVRGLTDSMSGIDRDESSQPGMWDCNVEFINESEFQIKLEDVKVAQKITTGVETIVSQTPEKLLNPDETWSYNFLVEAKNVPELSSEIGFTPLFVVIPRVIGKITKESTIYPVLSATIDKSITPLEVDAYATTEMTILNTIINNGTSPINSVSIVDEIPADFVPPLVNEILVKIGDLGISSREEYIKRILVDPTDQDFGKKHKINIDLSNLSNEFLPEKKMLVSYPLVARDPRPPTEAQYLIPVKLEINTTIEGQPFIKIPDEEPELKVKYVKRGLKTLKSIKPGFSEGEFIITIRIQNKGDVELENVIVKDKIPSGFTLTEFTPSEGATHSVRQIVEESELEIKFAEIIGGSSVNINYNCSGSGDYPRSEPNVVVMGKENPESIDETSLHSSETEIPKAHVSEGQVGMIHDEFTNIFKQVNLAITGDKLGQLLEELRDNIPPGPNLHQILAFAREMRALGDKMLVGSLRDEVVVKLRRFQNKYV
ncbi:MAG: hypothetical protein ACFFBI_05925 [Promethearchaeota archaeon]